MARELAVAITGFSAWQQNRGEKGSLPAGATDVGKAALLSLRGYQVVYYVFDFFLFGGDDSLMMEANFTS